MPRPVQTSVPVRDVVRVVVSQRDSAEPVPVLLEEKKKGDE